jgi:hypothetical protein
MKVLYRETRHYPAAWQVSTGRTGLMFLLFYPCRPARL